MHNSLIRRVTTLLALSWCTLCAGSALADAVWIDVRSAAENRLDGIPGDANIPHEEIGDAIGTLVPDKSTEIVLYCRSGRRSGIALETLQRLGYTDVRNAGGIAEARKEHPATAATNCC